MTTDVMESTAVDEEIWEDDPSNPAPAMEFSSELEEGVLTISAYIDLQTQSVRPSFGAENDARILKQCQNYADKSGGYSYTLWFLEAEGISVVRSDGAPFRISDILKLRSKKGDKLGANQAHAQLAKRYEDMGVNASFTATKAAETALGHRFHFKSEKLTSGGRNAEQFAKPISLVPQRMYADNEHFEGEVRVVTPKTEASAPADGGPVSSLSEAEVIGIIREAYAGKTPGELMQVTLDLQAGPLAGVMTVFGVPLLESAVDESIVTVLQENRCMALQSDGTLVAI